jgi:hypothetical protein
MEARNVTGMLALHGTIPSTTWKKDICVLYRNPIQFNALSLYYMQEGVLCVRIEDNINIKIDIPTVRLRWKTADLEHYYYYYYYYYYYL